MKSVSRKLDSLCIKSNGHDRGKPHQHLGKLLSCALCVFLALPGMAAAKKASTGNSVSCAVLLPAYIETGNSFSVKVVRVPSYPGSWTQPTIYIDVVYPTTSGNLMSENYTQTIDRFNVTYATKTFTVPSVITTDIASSPNSPDATATVTATISEQHRGRQTACSATTAVIGVN